MIPHNLMAVTVGTKPPVVAVLHSPPADPGADSGFSVLFSDAPSEWKGTDADVEKLGTACLHCLIDHYPEAGRGLDLAKLHGEATLDPDTGEWTAGEG